MAHRIKRAVAGVVLSAALAGGAAGAVVATAAPASATSIPFSFFIFPCTHHGHEVLFCDEEL